MSVVSPPTAAPVIYNDILKLLEIALSHIHNDIYFTYLMTETEVQNLALILDSNLKNGHDMDKRNYSTEQLDVIL